MKISVAEVFGSGFPLVGLDREELTWIPANLLPKHLERREHDDYAVHAREFEAQLRGREN